MRFFLHLWDALYLFAVATFFLGVAFGVIMFISWVRHELDQTK